MAPDAVQLYRKSATGPCSAYPIPPNFSGLSGPTPSDFGDGPGILAFCQT